MAAASPTRALVRRPETVDVGRGDEVVLGDLERSAVARAPRVPASRRVPRVVTRPANRCARDERDRRAPSAAGLERIVKISNIPIAGLESGLHGNHRAIERRLAASPVAVDGAPTVVLHDRHGSAARADRARAGSCCRSVRAGSHGSTRDDIAEVAVAALTRDIDGPLQLTGPEALDGDEVAARLGVRRVDPPLVDVA